jgi:hypothetical protein
MPIGFFSQTVTQSVPTMPGKMGMQVVFPLTGVAAGDVALLVPLRFDPHVHIRYPLAVVDATLSVTFEFVNEGLNPVPMPPTYKFFIVTGL